MCTVTDIDHTLQFHNLIHTEEHKEKETRRRREREKERGYRQKYQS